MSTTIKVGDQVVMRLHKYVQWTGGSPFGALADVPGMNNLPTGVITEIQDEAQVIVLDNQWELEVSTVSTLSVLDIPAGSPHE